MLKDRPHDPDFLPWELAVAYGDGRGGGLAEVEARLAIAPTDRRARFGHAYLSRLHGRHEQAIVDATACHEQAEQTAGARSSPGASFVAAFLAEEHAALGHWTEALAWYRKAIEGGGKAAGALAVDAARIAEEKLGDRQAAAGLWPPPAGPATSWRAGERKRSAGREP